VLLLLLPSHPNPPTQPNLEHCKKKKLTLVQPLSNIQPILDSLFPIPVQNECFYPKFGTEPIKWLKKMPKVLKENKSGWKGEFQSSIPSTEVRTFPSSGKK